jgi:hypothetical protein
VSGDVPLVIEITPGFGRDLHSRRTPEIGTWIDGSMPFRAETIRPIDPAREWGGGVRNHAVSPVRARNQ